MKRLMNILSRFPEAESPNPFVRAAIKPGTFECIGRRSAWCRKAERSDRADSETPRRLLHGTSVLHRAGCSQAEDQLLRKGRHWQGLRRGIASRHTA